KISELNSDRINHVCFVKGSLSGEYAPLLALNQLGLISEPTIEACGQRGWAMHPYESHAQLRASILKLDGAIGFTHDGGLGSEFKKILIHGRYPQDVVVTSGKLRAFEGAILTFLQKEAESQGPLSTIEISGIVPYVTVHAEGLALAKA